MKKFYALSLSLFFHLFTWAQIPKKLAVIGSSTSACTGYTGPVGDPMHISNCYINKLVSYYNANGYTISLQNLAVPGYHLYTGMPNGSPPYSINGRDYFIDPNRNISAALTLPSDPSWHADVIIVNYPSNNYQYPEMDIHTVMAYFRAIKKAGNDAGKPVFITTTQPRNSDYDAASRLKLIEIKDSINLQFGYYAVDFWTTIANPDGTIAAAYNLDNIHINAAGHDLFFQRLQAKNIFAASLPVRITSFAARTIDKHIQLKWSVADEMPGTSYKLQRSPDGQLFQTIAEVQGKGTGSKESYDYTDRSVVKGSYFYRLEINEPGNKFYSRVEKGFCENRFAVSSISTSGGNTIVQIVSSERGNVQLRILNSTGTVIRTYSKNVETGTNIIRLSHLPLAKGVYWIESFHQAERLFVQAFIAR